MALDVIRVEDLPVEFDNSKVFTNNINAGALAQIVAPVPTSLFHSEFLGLNFNGEMARVGIGEAKPKAQVDAGMIKQVSLKYAFPFILSEETFEVVGGALNVALNDVDDATLRNYLSSPAATELVAEIQRKGYELASRALDLAAIHGVNPATGQADSSVISFFDQSATVVDSSGKGYTDLLAAKAKVPAISGAVISNEFSGLLDAEAVASPNSLFGAISLGKKTSVLGTPAGQSDTVADDLAIVGDFANNFRWGMPKFENFRIFREQLCGIDLSGTNSIGLLIETRLKWAINDVDSFAVIKSKSAAKAAKAEAKAAKAEEEK